MRYFQVMRFFQSLFTICLSSVFVHATAQDGKVIDSVVCKTDPAQSYALYIPIRGDKQALPIVYFFDPHGDGALPLRKYRMLAETYGFILAGSNNSKNGNDWPTTEYIWRHLYSDVQGRLKIRRDRIYTCGFSGGAKVASYVAIGRPAEDPVIKGVVANGAGLPDGVPASDLSFSFTAIAGEGDMNMTNLVFFSHDLDKTRTRHRLILFDGRHEWAPLATMGMAFAGWQFDAMRDRLIPKDDVFIHGYVAKSRDRVAKYSRSSRLIKAQEECRISIDFLDGLGSAAAWFMEKDASISADPSFLQEKKEQEHLLEQEENIKAGYAQHFQQRDMSYWTATIADLKKRAGEKVAGVKGKEQGMVQRLLAYLSLAFYSLSNHMIDANDNGGARYFVDLYKMADPGNSEAWYLSAVLDVRENQPAAAESDLHKAAQNGFTDRNRLLRQFEFQGLPNREKFFISLW
jgi:pimeloyl-ACP methyl ester carboxylesterase